MSATWKQILCEETLRCLHLKFLPALSTHFWTSGKGHSFLQKNTTWQGMAKSKQSYVFKKNTRNELTPNTLFWLSDCLLVSNFPQTLDREKDKISQGLLIIGSTLITPALNFPRPSPTGGTFVWLRKSDSWSIC